MNQMMLTFFIVLACATVLYYLIPLKHRWIVLLAASIIFYSVISTYLTPFVIVTSLSVWLCAKYIQKQNDFEVEPDVIKKRNKTAMVLVVVFNLAIIVFLKFYTPVANLLNTLFGKFG